MIISNKRDIVRHNCHLQINNSPLKEVKETKFLGIVLDNKLTFKSHINHVANKVAKITYIIYRIKSYVPCSVLKTLYYSLAYPHLTYNITIWGSASASTITPLIIQTKRLIRLIYGSQEYLSHTNLMFKELQILKLYDIYKLSVST